MSLFGVIVNGNKQHQIVDVWCRKLARVSAVEAAESVGVLVNVPLDGMPQKSIEKRVAPELNGKHGLAPQPLLYDWE